MVTKIAVIGTVGVPANYGGFETLVENIIKQNSLFIAVLVLIKISVGFTRELKSCIYP